MYNHASISLSEQQQQFNHYTQQHRYDSKPTLKLEHFKFSPSNKSITPHNSALTNTNINTTSNTNSTSFNSNSTSKKNVLLTIHNQNLLVSATLNASIQAIAANNNNNTNSNSNQNTSRHKVLRNKVFNAPSDNSTNPNNTNSNNELEPNLNSSTSSQQAMQQKLTYLKRYVANGLANKNSLQFSDGYWNRIPGSKLKTTTIRTNPNNSSQINLLSTLNSTSNGTNKLLAKNAAAMSKIASNGNFISLQNVSNGQLLPNRELSIIDLQLPVKKPSSPAANQANQQQQQQQLMPMPLHAKKSPNFMNPINNNNNNNTTNPININSKNDYYTSQSHHSTTSDTSDIVLPAHTVNTGGISPSKIMLTAIIKPQLNLNHHSTLQDNTKTNGMTMDAHFQEISQFFNSSDQSPNGFDQFLNGDKNSSSVNFSNYKNKNYFKYVMNQQKKRQQLNSGVNGNNGANGGVVTFANSVSSETLNSTNASNLMTKRQVQLLNHEVPIHSNLNNISSNALLIRRLKF